jgi:hypothetical protein
MILVMYNKMKKQKIKKTEDLYQFWILQQKKT